MKILRNGEVVQGEIITGSRSLIQAFTVPEINQVFLGGQFNDVLTMGDVILNSPLSNNVYLTYFKDDTWLYNGEVSPLDLQVYPNPFTDFVQLSSTKDVVNIKVVDIQGNKMLLKKEAFFGKFGQSWPNGVYYVNILKSNGERIDFKVLKVK